MDDTNESEVLVDTADEAAEVETPEAELQTTTDWEAEAKKARRIASRLRSQLTKVSEKKVEVKVEAKPNAKAPSGGLDENALDFLDLKGVTEAEDIKVIEDIVAKTGMTVRQALKDEYVQGKLNVNKAQREVKAATPSSTKRAGAAGGSDLDTAIARYEQSGFDPKSLPDDFRTRSAVINAIEARTSVNKPAWK